MAKLGTGAGTAEKTAATTPLRPIHLSIKGSTVTAQPDGDAKP